MSVPSRARTLLFTAGLLAVIAGVGAPALAADGPALSAEAPARAAGAAPMPSAVEDFGYPNAAQILEEKKIKLIKGDGRITLAECDTSAQQIRVSIRRSPTEQDLPKNYCFAATGKKGLLTLEVPNVFYLETADHPISAELTAGDKSQTVNVPKDDFKSVGEGVVGGARTMLVELRVTG